jgi:neutral amino acid transport system permease protein
MTDSSRKDPFVVSELFGRVRRRQVPLPMAQRLGLAVVVLALLGLLFGVDKGATRVLQTTLNGLVTGSYLALAAVGLTFVYGILRLINFAHGDFLTFGAYVGLYVDTTLHAGIVAAVLFAIAATALLAVVLELGLWGPLRRRGAGSLELILTTIGLAFLIRYSIEFIKGPDLQTLNVNVISFYRLGHGITIGRTIAVTMLASYAILIVVGVLLRYTRTGKQMRALADNVDLAETSGLNSRRLVLIVWTFGGGLAGLAGVFYVASTGAFTPEFGFTLLLPLFAAVLIGGAGNPYGALAGGVFLGVVQEWSTLFLAPGWKIVVAFVVLLLTLLIRPQGIFAPATRL